MRDDFSKRAARKLAERAAFKCSNPLCKETTIGPATAPTESASTGVAAHICAAAEGGPRYDELQTPEKRSSIENGIWLCATCARVIDNDEVEYSAAVLREWKHSHEAWVRAGADRLDPPGIELASIHGFSVPVEQREFTLDENFVKRVRENRLTFANPNQNLSYTHVECRLQLPERVIHFWASELPAGVDVQFRPSRMDVIMTGASISTTGPLRPSDNWLLRIAGLRPQQRVSLVLWTITDGLRAIVGGGADNIQGTCESEFRGRSLGVRFGSPIRYDEACRSIDMEPIRRLREGERLPQRMSFP